MKILELLDELDEIIDGATAVPLTGKVLLDRNELLEIIKEARIALPDEVKQAKWIKEERAKILEDAAEEASRIVKNGNNEATLIIEDARAQAGELVDKNIITTTSREHADALINEAKEKANEIETGAYTYADELLERFEGNLNKMVETVNRNREELHRYKNS